MKMLVTGVAGFIGSHLVDRLLADGHEVVGIDDLSAGRLENISGHFSNRRFLFFEEDICDFPFYKLNGGGDPVHAIFHLAASKKNICLNDPRRDLMVNAGATLKLLQWASQGGVKYFVHSSTGSVYGDCDHSPIDEQTPLNPCSYYGISKQAGERYVAYFHRQGMIQGRILRYFHVYGPRQDWSQDRGGVIAIWIDKALSGKPLILTGDRTITRTFTWVEDVVDANVLAITTRWPKEILELNISAGKKVTLGEVIDGLEREAGKKVEVIRQAAPIGDVPYYCVQNYASRAAGLSYTDFEIGFRNTVQWHRKRKS